MLNMIDSLMASPVTGEVMDQYFLALMAFAQLQPPEKVIAGGQKARDIATTLRTYFTTTARFSRQRHRALSQGWREMGSAPKTGREFWGFLAHASTARVRWSVARQVFVKTISGEECIPVLWLPLLGVEKQKPPPAQPCDPSQGTQAGAEKRPGRPRRRPTRRRKR